MIATPEMIAAAARGLARLQIERNLEIRREQRDETFVLAAIEHARDYYLDEAEAALNAALALVPDALAAEPTREDLTIVARSIGRTMKWENHQERAKDVFRSLRERDATKPPDKMAAAPDTLAADELDERPPAIGKGNWHKPFSQFKAEREEAEREAGRRKGLEEAARLIETTKEGYGPSGKYLVARIEGDTMGSAYAVGILALRDTPADGGEKP